MNNLDVTLKVRVSRDLLEKFQRAASAAGLHVSTWMRSLAARETTLRTVSEHVGPRSQALSQAASQAAPFEYILTGVEGLDHVLGGGLVPGSLTLLAGPMGVGKSTLLLQAAYGVAIEGGTAVYASGEETEEAIRAHAERLGVVSDRVHVLGTGNGVDVDTALVCAQERDAKFLIFDSLQTTYRGYVDGKIGGVKQVNAVVKTISAWLKTIARDVAVVLICHLRKDGEIAGPKSIQHIADTVLRIYSLQGEDDRGEVLLHCDGKHRHGLCTNVAYLKMTPRGLAATAKLG